MRRSYFASLLFVFFLSTSLALRAQVLDDFDVDPRTDANWEFYEPEVPATYGHDDDGFFRVTLPANVNLDSWTTVDRAVQIRRSDFPEDFVLETRLNFLGSGDPENPLFPPVDESYNVGLLVRFSQFDLLHFGPYRGTSPAMERSGHSIERCADFNDLAEIDLQIRKQGSAYTFLWRPSIDEDWRVLCEREIDAPPEFVGLIAKSWAPTVTTEQTFEFDYFSIAQNPAPSIADFSPVDGFNFHSAAEPFVFSVTAHDGESIEDISLVLNGVDVSGDLNISGPVDSRTVSFNRLDSDISYNAEITAIDSAGNESRSTHRFGTFSERVDEPGLLHYFPFDEVSGLSAFDLAGGQLGELQGFDFADDTHWVDGWVDGGLDLGVDGSLNNQMSTTLEGVDVAETGGYSIAMWVRPGEQILVPGEYQLFDGDNIGFTIINTTIDGIRHDRVLLLWDGSLPNLAVGTTSLAPNNWYHVAVTSTGPGGERLYYLNGQPETKQLFAPLRGGTDQANRGAWVDGATATIGGFRGNGRFHDSVLDDLRIYSKALTPEEVADLVEVSPPIAPSIDDFNPADNYRFHRPASGFGFTVTTPNEGASIAEGSVELILNDLDVSDQLSYGADPVSRTVHFDGLDPSTTYRAEIRVSDSLGATVATTYSFATFEPIIGDVFDDFDDDPRDSPEWELHDPLFAGFYDQDDSFFSVTLPQGIVLDHWVAADNAIQLRRYDVPDNFEIETLVRFLGSGNPPTWPPSDESYNAGLMVQFSQFDTFIWGFQRGTPLVLQRTGSGPACVADPALQEVELRIRKVGQRFSFGWREPGAKEWDDICVQTAVNSPVAVGLKLKSWNPAIANEQVFEFENFVMREVEPAPPAMEVCHDAREEHFVGMPYRTSVSAEGIPEPTITLVSGPEGLVYDPIRGTLEGWTPGAAGTETIEIEATNAEGTVTDSWDVVVGFDPQSHDDEFEDDPTLDSEVFEFWEPQLGVVYSIVEDAEDASNSWFRMDIPQTGDLGQNFDVWTTSDRAPQLRASVDPDQDFIIETRLWLDPAFAPAFNATFFAGIMVSFNNDTSDVLHWTVGQERNFAFQPFNLILERSGANNRAYTNVEGLLEGTVVDLRIKRSCNDYHCYSRVGDAEWNLVGTYVTTDTPTHVGLLAKTWGPGAAFSVEFDYFDFAETGDDPPPMGDRFVRGDTDSSGAINLTDGLVILLWAFQGGTDPACLDAADVDDSSAINLTDAIAIFQWLFLGGNPPAAPAPAQGVYGPEDCGLDISEDIYECADVGPTCSA